MTELGRPDQAGMFKNKTKIQNVYIFVAYIECKFSMNILGKCEVVMSMEDLSPSYSKIILKPFGADEVDCN